VASVVIAGAGVLGRLLAWRLARAGHPVQVVDPAPGPEPRHDGQGAAAFTAAGMLSPLAELEVAGAALAAMGWRAVALWESIASALPPHATTPLVTRQGSLLLAHPQDRGSAQRVLTRLQAAASVGLPLPRTLQAGELAALEPALAPRLSGWWLEGEGQVLPSPMMQALCDAAAGVTWHWGRHAEKVEPRRVVLDGGEVLHADWAVDTRGLGAKGALPLRGVRGEVLWLHAPGVALRRPLRLLHPRHRVYLVPRPGDVVVVGASEVESEDRSGVSLASAVELMTAAQSALPGLAEARIVHLETNLRPAMPDNLPVLLHEPGLVKINGLFRHGWLLAPALVDDAINSAGLA
jgi:glycine oxidase